MLKTNKTHIAQIVLITFLGFALIAPIAPATADVTIALQGQIDPATIDIAIDKANLNMDIAAGQTQANDTVTVTSTAQIPVKMTLESVSHKAESWSPTLITEDPTTLGLTDAQNQARLTFSFIVDDPDYATAPPATVTPTGDGSTVDGAVYPVNLGTIIDSEDGVAEKSVVVTGKLEASKKRILSKAFNSQMVLNFAAAE